MRTGKRPRSAEPSAPISLARLKSADAAPNPPKIPAILVPTDFNNPARRAFILASLLAGTGVGKLTLMHAVDLPAVPSSGLAAGPLLPAGYLSAWESRLRMARPRGSSAKSDYRIEVGDPVASILRASRLTDCNMIVMGTQRKTGLPRMWGKSVSLQVARQASCPVLTLTLPPVNPVAGDNRPGSAESTTEPWGDDVLDYRTVLHPTDFSASAMRAFEVARELCRRSGRDLLVVHFAPAHICRTRSARMELDEKLRRLVTSDPGVRMRGLLLPGHPASQIVCTATQADCGLIVMGESGRTGLSRLWHGSVSGAVRNRAHCPALTIQIPGGEVGSMPDITPGHVPNCLPSSPRRRSRLNREGNA